MEPMQTGAKADDAARDCALLSCLLDGELDGELDSAQCAALLEQLRSDEKVQQRWALLNCAGDALRSPEVAAWHRQGFVARVSAALEAEPTVLAPAARSQALRRWFVPAAGAAAAAAMLIVVVMPQQRPEDAGAVASAPQTAPVAVTAPAGTVKVDRLPALERYLAAHRELAAPALMPRATPYLRASAIDVPERR